MLFLRRRTCIFLQVRLWIKTSYILFAQYRILPHIFRMIPPPACDPAPRSHSPSIRRPRCGGGVDHLSATKYDPSRGGQVRPSGWTFSFAVRRPPHPHPGRCFRRRFQADRAGGCEWTISRVCDLCGSVILIDTHTHTPLTRPLHPPPAGVAHGAGDHHSHPRGRLGPPPLGSLLRFVLVRGGHRPCPTFPVHCFPISR